MSKEGKRKPKQRTWSHNLYGILNAFGDPWSYHGLGSKDEAEAYLRVQKAKYPNCDLSKHTVGPISVTVHALTKAGAQ